MSTGNPLVAPRRSMTNGPGGPGFNDCASVRDPRSRMRHASRSARAGTESVPARRFAGRLAARLFDDTHTGARAYACRTGSDHGLQPFQIANAARRLHAHFLAHHTAHERDVSDGGAARSKAGGGLHEVGT